jgi:signal transduction histidine kinase
LRYTLAYVAFGSAWILVSDAMLTRFGGPLAVELISIAKGLAYVAVTALLLYFMIRRNARSLRALNHELEQRVEERTRALEAVNEELSSFSYSVSHDLRAPLRAISGFSQILREDCSAELGDEALDYLQRISSATTHMNSLIDGLLDLSRAARVELTVTRVSLTELGEKAVEGLRSKDPTRDVAVEIEPDMLVDGDARLLSDLVENLLENAWKFTSRCDHATVRFGKMESHGKTAFCVADNGVGFCAKQAADLFRPFKRLSTASAFPGEGIGLATVRRIVQRHGGELWAEGEEEHGAHFYFTLPHGSG